MLNAVGTSKWRKFLNACKRFFSQPANIILVITVAVLGFFTLYPLLLLIIDTFRVQIADKMLPGFSDVKVGSFTGLHWATRQFDVLLETFMEFAANVIVGEYNCNSLRRYCCVFNYAY